MAQKGPSFSEWFAARQVDAPAGTMAVPAPPPPAPSVLSSLFSGAATAPSLSAAPGPDAEKSSGGGGSGGSSGGGSGSAGGGSSSGSAGLPAAASAAAASLTSLAALMMPGVVRVGQSVGLGGLAPGVPAPVEEWNCGMNAAQRFQAFGILLVTSLLLYISAIFVFLPMVIFMPSKCVQRAPGAAARCMLAPTSHLTHPPTTCAHHPQVCHHLYLCLHCLDGGLCHSARPPRHAAGASV